MSALSYINFLWIKEISFENVRISRMCSCSCWYSASWDTWNKTSRIQAEVYFYREDLMSHAEHSHESSEKKSCL